MKNPFRSLGHQVYQSIRPPQLVEPTEAVAKTMQDVLQLTHTLPVKFIQQYGKAVNTKNQVALVHATQATAVNLADRVHRYLTQYHQLPIQKEQKENCLAFYRQLLQSLLELLTQLKRNYGLQFNHQQKITDYEQLKLQPRIMQFVQWLKEKAGREWDDRLVQLITDPLLQLYTTEGSATFSYAHSTYWINLVTAIETIPETSAARIEEILIVHNFNQCQWVAYQVQQYRQQTEKLETCEERMAYWANLQRNLNLVHPNPAIALNPALPACKQMLQTAIRAEQILQEQQVVTREKDSHKTIQANTETPIETTLTVTQLAGMIRLMVETGILTCNNQTNFLKNISKIFAVRNQKTYSPDSLRQKYYHPDTASLSILKTHLSNMLVQLKNYTLLPAILLLTI